MKYYSKTMFAISLSLLGTLFLCNAVWAGGASQGGGTSSGSGSVPRCSGTTIHEPSCEEKGGGKSWRIYHATSKSISKLNEKATWKIVQGSFGGKKVGDTLKTCVNNGANYFLALGLNSVVPYTGKYSFYVAFNQTKPKGECRENRGCYYDWNNYGAVSYKKIISGDFKNGQAVTNSVVKKLYAKAKIKDNLTFKEVGAFCAWKDDTTTDPEYTLTAYAKEYNGSTNPALNNGAAISSDTYKKGEEAEVTAGRIGICGILVVQSVHAKLLRNAQKAICQVKILRLSPTIFVTNLRVRLRYLAREVKRLDG